MEVDTGTDWKHFTEKWRGLLISHRGPDAPTPPPVSVKEKGAAQVASWEAEGGKGKTHA